MPSKEGIPQFETLEEEKEYWESKGPLGIDVRREEIVAYKVWRCKFCNEVRQDSTDMWRHLIDKHDKHSISNNDKVMWDNAR